MNALELNDIVRVFEHGTRVLDGVSLDVAPGEVVGLLGPNGAGKTTLIRIALGMLRPQGGTVRLFGVDPTEEPVEAKRRVGHVSEDQALPPYLRIRDVLGLHRDVFRGTWDDQLATELLGDFDLPKNQRISRLSKGQARRVAVLCAIAHRPELLILDEPAGGFDPAARREFLEVALRHLADDGTAVLFSSHHMADVERLASRVAVLDHGRKVVDEDLDALRETTAIVSLPTGDVPASALGELDGCLAARVHGGELRGVFRGSPPEVLARVEHLRNGTVPRVTRATLEEIFIELVRGKS